MIALDNITLFRTSRELFFMLGPSGYAKTILLQSIAGLHTPDKRQMNFERNDATNRASQRRRAGMIFQNYARWPHMAMFQNVAFRLEKSKMSKAKIKVLVYDILEKIQIIQYISRKSNELSGGSSG
jgi:ABC-type sugar transport system ATPase subunit